MGGRVNVPERLRSPFDNVNGVRTIDLVDGGELNERIGVDGGVPNVVSS